jgi:Tfp pilus assembly protein PilF
MLGWCYLQMGKMREAKVMFNKSLLNRPDDASALEGLSLTKYRSVCLSKLYKLSLPSFGKGL